MGYNPYKPVMSSTATSKGGGVSSMSECSSPPRPPARSSSGNHIIDPFEDVAEEVKLQLEAAVECLLHQILPGVADQSVSSVFTAFPAEEEEAAAGLQQGCVCIHTVVKMLTNLAEKPEEPKFR
jgi:hypothetical protein